MPVIIVLLVLLLFVKPVSAQRPYDDVSERFFESFDSGDYSKIEGNFTEEMKDAFGEKDFESFRDNLINKYGEYQSYEFVREEEEEYKRAYYKMKFEEANVTIRLVYEQVDQQYKIAGLQITDVDRDQNLILYFSLPIIGGFLGLAVFYSLGFKDIKLKEMGFGVLLLLGTLVIQPTLQNLPFILMGIRSNADILARGATFTIISALFIGFVAGAFQESIRYPLAIERPMKTAAFIGLGFGLAEAIIIPLIGFLASTFSPTTSFTTSLGALTLLERFLVTIFHGCTTVIMAYAYQKGWGLKALLGLIVAHGVLDTFAAHYQLTRSDLTLIGTFVVMAALTGVLLFYVIRIKDREEKTEPLQNDRQTSFLQK